jgi:hypothetical protein
MYFRCRRNIGPQLINGKCISSGSTKTSERSVIAPANSDSRNTGDDDSTVGLAKNGVYVKGEFSARAFFKALKAGRSFATTGPSLDFNVNGELMGDGADISDGSAIINLSVDSESPAAIVVKIDVIKNGIVWQTLSPLSPVYQDVLVDDSVTEDGYYRVENTAYDGEMYSFAWSNPVFVNVD